MYIKRFSGNNKTIARAYSVTTELLDTNRMLKIISLVFLLTVHHNTAQFRIYKQLSGERFSHDQHLIRSLAAAKLRCAVTCQQTTSCDSFHYNNNTSSVSLLNCELLMTSATDYAALTPAADWSVYSSQPLLTSGWGLCMICSVEVYM